MQTHLLTISSGADLGQLHDELILRVPALAPTPTGPDGRLEAQVIVAQISVGQIQIDAPDGVDPEALLDVVSTHVPRSLPTGRIVDPYAASLARMQLRATGGDPGGGLAGVAADVLVLLGHGSA